MPEIVWMLWRWQPFIVLPKSIATWPLSKSARTFSDATHSFSNGAGTFSDSARTISNTTWSDTVQDVQIQQSMPEFAKLLLSFGFCIKWLLFSI